MLDMLVGLELRDPVHGFIQRDPLEKCIIDTKIFQRLRRLRQLAMQSLVYPGAVHSRFDHSIGALHIARELAEKLVTNESDRRIIRLAALLHDIGHGPFSHVSEPILQNFSDQSKVKIEKQDEIHEQISWSIIQTDPELGRYLSEVDREHVIGVLNGTYGFSLYKDLVSGPIDVDKQDYLLRDSYFCGVKYGVYDRGRLADTLTVHQDADDKILALTEDGKHALEQFVLARYYMHTQVYRHKIRLITDQMLSRGILLGIKKDGLQWLKSLYSYDGSPEFIRNYLEWHDDRLILEMLRPETPEGKAKQMFRRIVERRLLKRIFRATEKTFADPGVRLAVFGDSDHFFHALEKKIAATYNFDEDFVIVNRVAFKSATKTESDIVVVGPSGKTLFRDASVLFNSVNQSIQEQYLDVYAPFEYRDERDKNQKEHTFYTDISAMICDILNPQQPLVGLERDMT